MPIFSDILMDTQILLWLAFQPEKLPRPAVTLLKLERVSLYFSQVSLWEVSMKAGLGRADFKVDSRRLVRGLLAFGAQQMDIKDEHLFAVASLPRLQGDAFDQLLVAQAQVEGMKLLTANSSLERYGPSVHCV